MKTQKLCSNFAKFAECETESHDLSLDFNLRFVTVGKTREGREARPWSAAPNLANFAKVVSINVVNLTLNKAFTFLLP